MKYVKAQEISIQLNSSNEGMLLVYQDDGVGLNALERTPQKGIGMKNIESRISVLSGELHHVNDSTGFHVEIRIPQNT
jgi:signal transduction histidine kinase